MSVENQKEEAKIPVLKNMADYLKAANADGLTIIEGTAAWCGQCKAIAPEVDKLAIEFPKANFYTYDVDSNPDVAQELGVSSMPTFTIFKDGDLEDSVTGAKIKELRAAVEKYL
ncbi:thioredoxin-like protein [Tothia fuscella]|uniref:Thioredoxin-like protein n=1 Tax=Tothia fuscella TaxID=1048955 RepID=A0A9P4TWE4_9PEZI|nr:thioredoxin-like protein [Tothia fuscella]